MNNIKLKPLRMTASELRRQYERHNPQGLFFSKNNMRFAGDTMSNYYVPAKTVKIRRINGGIFTCYELQRRKAVKGGNNSSAYFDIVTFDNVHGELID
jgi:hypothetical protein